VTLPFAGDAILTEAPALPAPAHTPGKGSGAIAFEHGAPRGP
jgi:hypothetical protein